MAISLLRSPIQQDRRILVRQILAHELLYGFVSLRSRETSMSGLVQDLRYAVRQLTKTPGFTLTCVLTLALGTGANTAVFSVMNAVLLKSLPVSEPDRVVWLNTSGAPHRTGTIDSHETFSYPVYEPLRARNTTRQREFSLRLALGAGPRTLFRYLLAEALLLVSLGGGLAWIFARSATKALGAWAQIESSLAPDPTVLLFTLSILAAAALLFGLAPLRVAAAGGPGLALKPSSARSNTDAGKTRTGKIVVAMQMALCVVLLVGGALLLRTLRNLQQISLGFPTNGLVVFGVNPTIHSLSEGRAFYQELISKMRALPGVESVTIMQEHLGSFWSNNNDMMVDGKLPDRSMDQDGYAAISPARTSFILWA